MALCWLALVLVLSADAEEPIVTDRPDFTESAIVVGPGKLQIENGVTRDNSDGEQSTELPETLVRYGIASRLEARLELPNYVAVNQRSGWSATAIGFKWQAGPTPNGVDMAWIGMLGLPSGSIDYGIRRVEPSLSLCAAKDLSDRLALSAMLSASWISGDQSRTEVLSTLSLGIGLTEKVGCFVEYAGTFSRLTGPENLLHAGLTYRPQPNLQWDLHAAVRLDKGARRNLIGLGLSYRF